MKEATEALSWEELESLTDKDTDLINGPNNSYSLLRLFGQDNSSIRVTFYRDKHAWCPYCQKVWLWLEWKRIPYEVKKVTMRCYGKKEPWYLQKVPSGIFPAIELDNKLITESDRILLNLEKVFGTLGMPLEKPEILDLRNLERKLFRAWCIWLCNPSFSKGQAARKEEQFKLIAQEVDDRLSKTTCQWLDPSIENSRKSFPGSVDVVFIPYLERMNASLSYYKGFELRKEFSNIDNWFKALELLDEYRGTQGDFHTHAHDLPPQMGGCWSDNNKNQKLLSHQIDIGYGLGEKETTYQSSKADRPSRIALKRVLKHRDQIKKVNPLDDELFDQPLRAALSKMIHKQDFTPTKGSALGLRYLRDRVSVPRDMPLLAARELRKALEETAQIDGPIQGPSIPIKNRFDQNPLNFSRQSQ